VPTDTAPFYYPLANDLRCSDVYDNITADALTTNVSSLIERIQARFGNVFGSISPDYNFCYRCLELVDSVLYYDQAAYVSYAVPRGNAGAMVGMSTDALKDFLATQELSGRRRSYAAPVPVFDTPINWIIHEYCLVQGETVSPRFPKVRLAEYLIRNLGAFGTMLAYKLPMSLLWILYSLRTRARKILSFEWATITNQDNSPTFESLGDAIDYAIKVPSNDNVYPPHLNLLRGSLR